MLRKRTLVLKVLFLAFAPIFILAGCGSIENGVRNGISGIFTGGSASSGSSGDRQRAAAGCFGVSPLDSTESGGTASRSRSRGQGEALNVSWPSDGDWDGYGLKGLKQPAGSTVVNVALFQGTYLVSLVDAGKEAYNDMTSQIKMLTGVRNPYSLIKTENGEMCEYQFDDHYVQLVVDYVDMELVIRALQ
jgi:hypothetical protein